MWHECDIYYGSLSVVVGYSVATSSSESLLNDCEKPKKLLFLNCDLIWLNFREACIQFSRRHSAKVVFINLYWKDGHSGKTGGFCKHKFSSLYNQAVEAKKRCMTPDIGTYYPNCTGQ